MKNLNRSGADWKKLARNSRVMDAEIMVATKLSLSTLYKFYRDDPTLLEKTRRELEQEILRLVTEKEQASA